MGTGNLSIGIRSEHKLVEDYLLEGGVKDRKFIMADGSQKGRPYEIIGIKPLPKNHQRFMIRFLDTEVEPLDIPDDFSCNTYDREATEEEVYKARLAVENIVQEHYKNKNTQAASSSRC